MGKCRESTNSDKQRGILLLATLPLRMYFVLLLRRTKSEVLDQLPSKRRQMVCQCVCIHTCNNFVETELHPCLHQSLRQGNAKQLRLKTTLF